MREPQPPPLPRYSILLLSALALGYEVLLVRLFSIIQWHHFAYMVISLALLGYGASGTFLTFAGRRLLPRFGMAYPLNIALFGITTVVTFLIVQRIPFNPEEMLWNGRQLLRLTAAYLLLALPFFFVANAIGLALYRHHGQASRIYAADLLGAGAGSFLIILLLFLLYPQQALLFIAVTALLVAVVGRREARIRTVPATALGVLGVVVFTALAASWMPPAWLELRMSPYKEMSQLQRIDGTRVIAERSSPLGLVSVVESSRIPLRHAPGLSLAAVQEPPPQRALFTDGSGMSAITRYPDSRDELGYLDQLTSALPYHLAEPDAVLVLGAGGGSEVLQARYHQVGSIRAVELNPQVADLMRNRFGNYAGNIYARGLHVGEARDFVDSTGEHFDLIQLASLGDFGAGAAGLQALNEDYLSTVEALQAYLERVSPGGYVAITGWVHLPPRNTLKLFATAVAALQQTDADARQQLVLIRGWQTATLLIKQGQFSADELAALRNFCEQRLFDLVYYPGIESEETNRFNRLQRPWFYQGATALLDDAETFIQHYKFDIRPATDDRPYFHHFFRWQSLPEILSLWRTGGLSLLEMGYFVLIATLVQALLFSALLILLPLVLAHRTGLRGGEGLARTLFYFAFLGLGFMFVEIAFIQKSMQFLHHPLYSVAVVLAAFLLLAGLGSAYSARWAVRGQHRRGTGIAVAAIVSLTLAYLFLLDPLFSSLTSWPDWGKILLVFALLAPIAFFMGMPFPLGIARVGAGVPALVPWAWAVNGYASVVSAVLAMLLAVHLGFTLVMLLAVLLYMAAAMTFPAPDTGETT